MSREETAAPRKDPYLNYQCTSVHPRLSTKHHVSHQAGHLAPAVTEVHDAALTELLEADQKWRERETRQAVSTYWQAKQGVAGKPHVEASQEGTYQMMTTTEDDGSVQLWAS